MSNFDEQLAEVPSLQHANERLRRLLQPVDEIVGILAAASGNAGANLPQEGAIVIRGKLVVDGATDALRLSCSALVLFLPGT